MTKNQSPVSLNKKIFTNATPYEHRDWYERGKRGGW